MHAALPMPDDVEASIAHALVVRDLVPHSTRFWPREAKRLGREATEPELLELDRRWRHFMRGEVLAVINATPDLTRRVMDVVNRFTAAERNYAYSVERSRLTDPREQQRHEDAYAEEILGRGYVGDPSWLARLHTQTHAGSVLQTQWRKWNRSEERVRALSVPRNPDFEREILQDTHAIEPKLRYAEWLCEQPNGDSLGEYLQLAAAGKPSWRAALLLEHDPDVLGQLAERGFALQWEGGLVHAADIGSSDLELLFSYVAAFAVASLTVRINDDVRLPRSTPELLRALTVSLPTNERMIREVDGVPFEQRLRETIEGLAGVAPIEHVRLTGPLSRRFAEVLRLDSRILVVTDVVPP